MEARDGRVRAGTNDQSEDKHYSEMSDSEFRKSLRQHMNDHSWDLGQWEELERRGFGVADGDPDLRAAIEAESARLRELMNRALAQALERMKTRLVPLQDRLRSLTSERGAMSEDVVRLLSPSFARPVDYQFLPSHGLVVEGHLPDVQAELVDDLADAREKLLETEIHLLEQIGAEVARANEKDWYTWATLVLAGIAAVAAVVGVIIAL